MSESVTRHRFADSDDPVADVDEPLTPLGVAPGATAEYAQKARDGARIAYSLYFLPAVDVLNTDEMTVRGTRFPVQVEQWSFNGVTGTVVLCEGGVG